MAKSDLLPAEIVKTSSETDCTIIWLHGLGADGHDFLPIVPELKLPEKRAVKFIFPHAPVRPVTVNNGYKMRAWYDVLAWQGSGTANEQDILKSAGWITAFIDNEIDQGVKSENIVLAGFSQGGVIAFHAALRYPERLAGIMGLSTYIPFMQNLFRQMHPVQKGLPIFAGHGKQDPVIPFASWQGYVPRLEQQGFNVVAHAYEMQHSVCMEEIADISDWLQRVLL